MCECKLAAGEIIYRAGDKANALYQILEGYVDATNVSVDGKEVLYHVMRPGDCFGETGLIEDALRTYTSTARGTTRLAVLSNADFQQLRQTHPAINHVLLEIQTRRFSITMEHLGVSTLLTLREQIIRRLTIMANAFGENRGSGVFIPTDLSQAEWANMLGASRQSINKELKALERRNLIQQQADGIMIYNLGALSDSQYSSDNDKSS